MHGIIFLELKKYVESKLGHSAWPALLKSATLQGKLYMPIQEYPDAEMVALVTHASATTGLDANAILEDFGSFIVPDLLQVYGSLIRKSWKTLDTIENTEKMIHRVVRIKNPGAKPPELVVARPSPTEVIVTYTSARKMCALAKGIVTGIAKHHNEQITITEKTCMLRGDAACTLSVVTRA